MLKNEMIFATALPKMNTTALRNFPSAFYEIFRAIFKIIGTKLFN